MDIDKLKENIRKNFDRFVSYYIDNDIYESDIEIYSKEEILNYYAINTFKFIIDKNDLIISICDVNLINNKNILVKKIGCIKTELDEVLNNSNALQVTKCYLDINQFKN